MATISLFRTDAMVSQTVSLKENMMETVGSISGTFGAGSILIVEDAVDLAVLLEYNLKKAGYTVHTAGNGVQALQLVEEKLPDVILLDILLPQISGWEVCRRIRANANEEVASIPIMMLTALRDDEDKYRGLELGADVYIGKPYAIREVLLHCRNLVANRKKHLNLIRMKSNQVAEEPSEDVYRILFHELKNQLTIIGGMTGILDRKAGNKRELKYIRAIRMSTDYLESIAGEIKVLDRACRKQNIFSRDAVSLNGLIKEAMALVSPLAYRKNITLHFSGRDKACRFRQNKTAVKIILVILLENAVKYSPPRSTVGIELTSTARGILLAVADTGPGIELEEQGKIFDKAYRTRQARVQFAGTGLGLYLARRLAESMNCSIGVKSRVGEGSTFTCSFPV